MIARPPEKKPLLKTKTFPPFFLKVANDNRPPQKIFLGWILFGTGVLLLISAFLWI
jgi:hypothetical protein